MQETQVQSLGWEDTPEEDPLQDSCLRIPWTEKPGRLQFIRLQRVGQDACKIGNGPRWQSRKTLLTSFYTFTGIPKLQLFTEQLLLRSESREKIFYNERYKEGTPRQVRGVELQYRRTHTPGWATHKREGNYNCRGSPQKATGVSPTSGSSAWGILQSEDEPPELMSWKSGGAYFQEIQRVVEIDSILTWCSQTLTHFRTPGRSSNLKGT